ncbi:MAG TPA: NUDIX domain-containing protein [Candidatus Saccharibacteria bacterium]|nr:NUDIX domain-containing protein [Candidatus Saccharibacteria bacterium]
MKQDKNRTAARAIIIRDNKLLVMKRNKFDDIYYALIGGGVDPGETIEQALVREVDEETSMTITTYRKVFIEPAWGKYGDQHIYLCEDPGGEPELQPSTGEAKLNKLGGNTFKPMWLEISEIPKVKFRSPSPHKQLVICLRDGFKDEVIRI